MTVQLRRGVVSRITDFLDLLPKCESQPVFGSYVMKRPLAPYQRGQALGTIEPLSQRARREGFAQIRRRKACRAHQCRGKHDLQIQLLLLAPQAVWQTAQHA